MHRCLLPLNVLLPRRGHNPAVGGQKQGVIAARGTGQSAISQCLALFHAAACHGRSTLVSWALCTTHPREHPDPRKPLGLHRPPCSRTTGSDTGMPLAPRLLQQLRVPALPRETVQPPTSIAPTHPSRHSTSAPVRSAAAGTEPSRQRHRGQSFVSAKENSLCRKGTACFLRGNWSVLFPRVSPAVRTPRQKGHSWGTQTRPVLDPSNHPKSGGTAPTPPPKVPHEHLNAQTSLLKQALGLREAETPPH